MNVANGLFVEKSKLKRNPNRRLKPFFQILIENILFILIIIPILFLTETFVDDTLLVILLILIFFLIMIDFVMFLSFCLTYLKLKNIGLRGEITFNEDGITDTSEQGRIITKKWTEMDLAVFTSKNIYFLAKRKIIFFIPNVDNNLKKIQEILEKYQNPIPIINKINNPNEKEGISKFFWNYGKYVLVFLLTTGLALFWDGYNINLIEKEIWKINNSTYEVDEKIYSSEKFAIVEETLKEYFNEFHLNRDIYNQNAATTTYSLLTIDFLKDQKSDIPKLIQELPEKEKKTTEAIENIIKLLDEDQVMSRIKEKNLGEFYEDLFRDYALTKEDQIHMQNWEREIEKNKKKTEYVKRSLEILISEDACWYIEEDIFYMCNEDQRLEYNALYNLILEKNEIEEETI